MPKQHPQFEPVAWWWARKKIGHDLRERYEVPKELPPKLQTLIMKVDAIEGHELRSHSGGPSDREQMLKDRMFAGIKAFPN
jgi:hypothetical protein